MQRPHGYRLTQGDAVLDVSAREYAARKAAFDAASVPITVVPLYWDGRTYRTDERLAAKLLSELQEEERHTKPEGATNDENA